MLESLKNKALAVLGGLTALLGLLFLYERSKRASAEAVAGNQETLDKLNTLSKEQAKNDGQLAAEAAEREDIKKETEDAKANVVGDADFFNSRK